MKVIFDISPIGDGKSGGAGLGRYASQIAMGLQAKLGDDVSFCAVGSLQAQLNAERYLARHSDWSKAAMASGCWTKLASLQEQILTGSSARSVRHGIFQYGLRPLLRAVNVCRMPVRRAALAEADVYHSSYARLPRAVKASRKLKRFLTVHDLTPLLLPPQFSTPQQPGILRRILQSLGPEDWAICVSQYTRNDLCNYLKMDAGRAFVAPLAASPELFFPCTDPTAVATIRTKYSIPTAPYLLSVATLAPHKNLEFLMRCFARLVQQESIELNLVLAGGAGLTSPKLREMAESNPGLRGRVYFTGYVPDPDLAALYTGALAFACPSLYEGFGLPPLEAMQCGTPVLVSNRSSLPEVVGDAGLLLDPTDESAWCQALLEVYTGTDLRARLSQQAKVRAGQFSWQKTIDDTTAAYRTALAAG